MDMKKTIALLFVALAIIVSSVSCNLDPVKDQPYSYITFRSSQPFSITPSYTVDGDPIWNGTLQHSTNLYSSKAWKAFNGKRICSAVAANNGTGEYVIYMRGVGNTVLSSYCNGWTLQATADVSCSGNILSLLNCLDTESATMGNGCFVSMFENWTHLVSVPTLPQTGLSYSCYGNMFRGCSSLCIEELPTGNDPTKWWSEKVVVIPSGTNVSSYLGMFDNCSTDSVRINQTETAGYTYCVFSKTEPQWKPYLTFSCDDPFTMTIDIDSWDNLLQYSTDGFNNGWTTIGKNQSATVTAEFNTVLQKYVVYLRGTNYSGVYNDPFDQTNPFTIAEPGVLVDCEGSLTSLINYENMAAVYSGYFYALFDKFTQMKTAPSLPAISIGRSAYSYMFNGCTSLVSAPDLPATFLGESCYQYMFKDCTSLENPPTISATTMSRYACYDMFQGCTALVSAPALPATTLAEGCYLLMFDGCASLEEAPELPATVLAAYCYSSMFKNCTNLIRVPAFPTNVTIAEGCYFFMFHNCSNLKIEEVAAGGTPSKQGASLMFTATFSGMYLFTGCSPSCVLSSNNKSAVAGCSYYCF